MLVLSRNENEKIMIAISPAAAKELAARSADTVIEVQLVEIRGSKARLGIVAPRAVAVHREEVFHAIHRIEEQHMKGEK